MNQILTIVVIGGFVFVQGIQKRSARTAPFFHNDSKASDTAFGVNRWGDPFLACCDVSVISFQRCGKISGVTSGHCLSTSCKSDRTIPARFF